MQSIGWFEGVCIPQILPVCIQCPFVSIIDFALSGPLVH